MTPTDIKYLIGKHKGSRFATLVYTAKGTGETARHTLVLGASIESLYVRDVAKLEAMHNVETDTMALRAIEMILESRHESLTVGIGRNSQYTCRDVYADSDVVGVRIHKTSNSLQVLGLSIAKIVIQKGTYRHIAHAPMTLAKLAIMRQLPSSRFRTFCLDNVTRIAANGETLEIG